MALASNPPPSRRVENPPPGLNYGTVCHTLEPSAPRSGCVSVCVWVCGCVGACGPHVTAATPRKPPCFNPPHSGWVGWRPRWRSICESQHPLLSIPGNDDFPIRCSVLLRPGDVTALMTSLALGPRGNVARLEERVFQRCRAGTWI